LTSWLLVPVVAKVYNVSQGRKRILKIVRVVHFVGGLTVGRERKKEGGVESKQNPKEQEQGLDKKEQNV
jgi:hypothetical protein